MIFKKKFWQRTGEISFLWKIWKLQLPCPSADKGWGSNLLTAESEILHKFFFWLFWMSMQEEFTCWQGNQKSCKVCCSKNLFHKKSKLEAFLRNINSLYYLCNRVLWRLNIVSKVLVLEQIHPYKNPNFNKKPSKLVMNWSLFRQILFSTEFKEPLSSTLFMCANIKPLWTVCVHRHQRINPQTRKIWNI